MLCCSLPHVTPQLQDHVPSNSAPSSPHVSPIQSPRASPVSINRSATSFLRIADGLDETFRELDQATEDLNRANGQTAGAKADCLAAVRRAEEAETQVAQLKLQLLHGQEDVRRAEASAQRAREALNSVSYPGTADVIVLRSNLLLIT